MDQMGHKATIEFRINTLSSQHEDMLFRTELTGLDTITKEEHKLYSQPIRVVSKTGAIKGVAKKKRGTSFKESVTTEKKRKTEQPISPTQSNVSSPSSAPYVDLTGTILEKIQKLEDQQREQQVLFSNLLMIPMTKLICRISSRN